jgi:glycosyltransferase involved in cell wall biosynthesis
MQNVASRFKWPWSDDPLRSAQREADGRFAWLDEFRSRHGRNPRVLHIGNIANNAYNNAKILNAIGVESDVLCNDYYHIMGCPEWEDADCDVGGLDHLKPAWYSVDLRGFERPRWFAQGPLPVCIDYLVARREQRASLADQLWRQLCASSGLLPPSAASPPPSARRLLVLAPAAVARKAARFAARLSHGAARRAWRLSGRVYRGVMRRVGRLLPVVPELGDRLGNLLARCRSLMARADVSYQEGRSAALVASFARHFPQRKDVLTASDVLPYLAYAAKWEKLFAHYDAVMGYAMDGLYPLLAGKRPYISYEHGTIRDIPFEDSVRGRLAALTYAEADLVFLTNADSIPQSRLLQARAVVKGLHGFDFENMLARVKATKAADIRYLRGADPATKVLISPARQHWREGFPTWRKGNDLTIRAVAKIAPQYRGRFKVVFMEWGAEVDLSKQLIEELGVGDFFQWIPPVPKTELWALYSAADCVIDQFVLPCIGSVTLEAIALGRPVITALDDGAMQEFYGETIPLLNCRNADEVAEAIAEVADSAPRVALAGIRSQEWFATYHTGEILERKLLEALREVFPKVDHAKV